MTESNPVADQAVPVDPPVQQPADPAAEASPVPGGATFADFGAPPPPHPIDRILADLPMTEAPPGPHNFSVSTPPPDVPADVPANDPPPPLRAARVTDSAVTAPREIRRHLVNPCNEQIGISVRDAPGPGGASHRYELWGFDITKNPSQQDWMEPTEQLTLLFQNGPIAEVGTNGITHEALLAVVIDRLEGFQGGQFACVENERALAHLQAALQCLRMRTHRREQAGTEGTLGGS